LFTSKHLSRKNTFRPYTTSRAQLGCRQPSKFGKPYQLSKKIFFRNEEIRIRGRGILQYRLPAETRSAATWQKKTIPYKANFPVRHPHSTGSRTTARPAVLRQETPQP